MPDLITQRLQKAAVAAGLLIAGSALTWPLTEMARQLFAAHMAQHLVLIVLAAPLLVLGGWRLRLLPPVWSWCLFVCLFLFWHWPAAFQWAARTSLTEALELASLFLAALSFWSVALSGKALNDGAAALYVTTAAIVTDLPGVVMLFAPRALCVMPAENAARFGLTPLQDQQLAGLLMWVPANLAFFGIATFLFARWIGEPQSLVTS
jgi:cytochrome c oxidase assembly factor CtaG